VNPNPKAPIRRFDVFAEYTRQKAVQDGMPEDEAEGYGLWVAKVVAARRFGGGPATPPPRKGEGKEAEGKEEDHARKSKWHDLGGKPQTDELFEDEIVGRMGRHFYNTVFVPAIENAIAEGKSYTAIRDTIRKEWKP
jgi:hypothetical protein